MFENTADKKYFNTYGGKFTLEVPENTPGALHRTAEKTGRHIHYLAYDRITGYVKGVRYRKHEHDGNTYRSIQVDMESSAGQFALEFNLFSRITTTFFHIMESIDPAKEVRFQIKRSGKKDSLFISQPDNLGRMENLKWNYTRENPGDRPPLKQLKKFDGEIEWDSTEQIQWFLQKLPDIDAKFKHNYATHNLEETVATMEVPEVEQDEYEEPTQKDDLPF